MALIDFVVTHTFDAPAHVVWDEMTDWPSHAKWIPATRIEIEEGDPRAVGGTFTGYTGYGPLTLVDRMRVSRISWDDDADHGSCEVEKLGPVLQGRAGFTVTSDGESSRVDWFEQVDVKYLPSLLAPIVSKLSAVGFSFGMRKLAKVIAAKQSTITG